MSKEITCVSPKFYAPIQKMFVSLANEKKFQSEVQFAVQIMKGNQYLQKMDGNSVLESVLNISQTGLTLNPVLNYAYLVPHKGKCVLYPSYQGLMKLATDTGSVVSIEVNLIYEGDDVVLNLASNKKIESHIPYILTGKDKGRIIGGYSLANLPDGTKHVEIMSSQDINDVIEHSESYKNDVSKGTKYSPWNTYESEMYRKTILKRHFKYLPKTEQNESLIKAIELDNKDYDFPMSYEQGNYIESLLLNSALPMKHETEITQRLRSNDFTVSQAKECIEFLLNNQRDAIQSGHTYSATDIVNKLRNEK